MWVAGEAARKDKETMTTSYFVVAAPGHYGDKTRVQSAHQTLADAHKKRGPGECVREGALEKGAVFLKSAEHVYARVEADGSRHGVP